MPSLTRRALLVGSAAATASLAGCGGAPPDVPAEQHWTQFGFDAANTATNPDARGPDERPSPAWVHLGGTYYHNSTQVLVGERVYANGGYAGLYALAPADGTVRWHDPTSYAALTPSLVGGGVVLPGGYGFRRVDADGGLAVLDRRLGYRRWQTTLAAYPQSPATVADGTLVAGVGTAGRSPGGVRVVAVDAADGTLDWAAPVESTVWAAPAVADGVVYAAQRSMYDPDVEAALYAFDLDTGAQRWRRSLGADPRIDPVDAPVVGDGLVYVSTGVGPLVAREVDSGDEAWTFDPPGGVQGSPALADGTLYVADLGGRIHALGAATGELRWSAGFEKCYGGPTVVGDGVYAASAGGTLASWRRGGSERWRVEVDPPVKGSPVVAGGRVYLGTSEGLVYALS